MADSKLLTCPLCLRADDPLNMVPVGIPHHAFLKDQQVTICQDCAAATCQAAADLATAAAREEQGGEQLAAERPADSNTDEVS